MNRTFRVSWSIIVVLLAVSGCGRLSRVTGSVTLDGKPVEGAVVSFVVPGGSVVANGVTNASGVFSLSDLSNHTGCLPGEYLVIIRKTVDGDQPNVHKQPKTMHLLPVLYSKFDASPLRCKVPVSGTLVFELSSSAN